MAQHRHDWKPAFPAPSLEHVNKHLGKGYMRDWDKYAYCDGCKRFGLISLGGESVRLMRENEVSAESLDVHLELWHKFLKGLPQAVIKMQKHVDMWREWATENGMEICL